MARTKKKRPANSLVHDRIVELEVAIAGVRDGQKTSPRTARLLAAGLPRMAQKLAEEATEVVIDAVRGQRSAVINESVDLTLQSRCAVERTRDHSLRGLGRNGSPPGAAWDGGEAAEGRRGGLDVLRRALAKRAVECCEMGWASVFPSSGSDDCPPI